MTERSDGVEPPRPKISPEFAARLERLPPDQRVRAIVLLQVPEGNGQPAGRQSPAERRAAIAAVRRSAQEALRDVDATLKRFGGTRLAPEVDALGSVPIEGTPAAIFALAVSSHVRGILENQRIAVLPQPPSAE